MDDADDSIFALLASSDNEDGSHHYSELPREHVWSDPALVDAWSAAMAEFANASLSQSVGGVSVLPHLDRESQLLASPLWYAPLCPPSGSKSSSSSSKKRAAPAIVEERQEEELEDDEKVYYDEEGEEEEEVEEVDEEQIQEALIQPAASASPIIIGPLQPAPSKNRSFVHPSRLDHVKEHQPYIDPSEWQPVTTSKHVTTSTQIAVTSSTAASHATIPATIPEPPSVGDALPQEAALTDSQTSQEALEKALNAWYTAGYAAAMYHVRSGLVKP